MPPIITKTDNHSILETKQVQLKNLYDYDDLIAQRDFFIQRLADVNSLLAQADALGVKKKDPQVIPTDAATIANDIAPSK